MDLYVLIATIPVLLLIPKAIGAKQVRSWQFGLVGGFFLAYLLIGLLVYGDAGVSIDENIQRRHGRVALKYIIEQFDPVLAHNRFPRLPDLETYLLRHYGMAFQLPIVIMEEILLPDADMGTVWAVRHYLNFLFFYLGVLAFYRLVKEKLDWRLALVGVILLVTTPRLFGESFHNVKDVPFFGAFTIALCFGIRFWRRKNILDALIFGLAAGFATNIRVIGLFLLPVVIGMTVIDILWPHSVQPYSKKRMWLTTGLVFVGYLGMLMLTSPLSWSNPAYLIETLLQFTNYELWNGHVMYMGQDILGQLAPWHYLPVWMSLTIPVSVIILFLIGAFSVLINSFRIHIRLLWQLKERENLAFLILAVLPIMAAILLESTVYNGWRHFTFIYSSFLLIALIGLQQAVGLFNRLQKNKHVLRWAMAIFLVGLGLYQLNIFRWMVVNHPHHIAYFNDGIVRLFGGRDNFERDYMRGSILQAIQKIAAYDPSELIVITSKSPQPARGSLRLFELSGQSRIKFVTSITNADYIIHTYRDSYIYFDDEADSKARVFDIAVDGLNIETVYHYDELLKTIIIDTPEGRTLKLDTYPFFTANTLNGPPDRPKDAEGNTRFNAAKFDIILPLDTLASVGEQVTISFNYEGNSSLINMKSLTCDQEQVTISPRILDGKIEFDVTINDLQDVEPLRCSLNLNEKALLVNATVTSSLP